MGKAFSLHTFSGHLGGALAPATMALLVSLHDWRFAMVAVGAFGIVAAVILLAQGSVLRDEHDEADADARNRAKTAFSMRETLELMVSPTMITLFLFFVVTTLAGNGIASFSQVINIKLMGVSLETAGTALSGFLFASTAGILAGGVAADKTTRHDAQASIAFGLCGAIFAGLAMFVVSDTTLVLLFVIAGFAYGMIRPARDMMVRALAPKGAAGRAFAWASTGISVGGAVGPIMFGLMVDMGATAKVYWVLAAFNVAAIATVTSTRWIRRAVPAEQPAE
jgi:FSR family fosmidomycin resistance protein-like MFS transporter